MGKRKKHGGLSFVERLLSRRFRGYFIRAPFDFKEAYAQRFDYEVAPALSATFVSLKGLLFLKRQANRPKDLQDIYYLAEINKELS